MPGASPISRYTPFTPPFRVLQPSNEPLGMLLSSTRPFFTVSSVALPHCLYSNGSSGSCLASSPCRSYQQVATESCHAPSLTANVIIAFIHLVFGLLALLLSDKLFHHMIAMAYPIQTKIVDHHLVVQWPAPDDALCWHDNHIHNEAKGRLAAKRMGSKQE